MSKNMTKCGQKCDKIREFETFIFVNRSETDIKWFWYILRDVFVTYE